MKITTDKSVSAEYELYVDGEVEGELELMEKATIEKPITFIFGVNMMLPKFEENLFGLQAGDKFDFTISSEDGYGDYDDESVLDLDRGIFEIDGKLDEEMIFEGNVVPLMDNEGNRINAQIVTITDTHVKVDLNHPLSGGGCGSGCGCGSGESSCGDGGCGDSGCGCDSNEEKTGGCGSGCGCN